jgi:hypothetical protein
MILIIDNRFIPYSISRGQVIFVYPIRKPQHLCWGWWKYLQKQEHQLLIEGGVKALPFQTGFTWNWIRDKKKK